MTAPETTEQVHDVVRRHQSSGQALLYRMTGLLDAEATADGSWVTGASGTRYLDLGSYAVFLLGHRHPRVVAAVADQLGRLAGSSRAMPTAAAARAVAALAGIAPAGLSKVMLLNSGAEAVEAAIKLARVSTGRSGVLHLSGSFHGKTTGALSLTDAELFRGPFQPLLPEVGRLDRTDAAAAADQIRAVRPAAVFAEPVQGEGGVFPLATDYLTAVRGACDETGALLVCDEIQSGLGRCGTTWASEQAGVVPDVLLTGKALGGGVVAASALLATPKAFRPYDRDPLLHTSTFGGYPLAAAAVAAAVEVIVDDGVPERAGRVGAALRQLLDGLCRDWPDLFTGVTGRGALLGLHCRRADIAGTFLRAAFSRGVLTTPCLTAPSVVRLTPSAYLTEQELQLAAGVLYAAAKETQVDLQGEED